MVQRYKILIEKPNKSCTNIEKCAKNVQAILRLRKVAKNGLSRHLATFPSDYQYIKW